MWTIFFPQHCGLVIFRESRNIVMSIFLDPCVCKLKKVKVARTRLPSVGFRVPGVIPVLGSQPAGDVSHEPGARLPLLSARPAVTPQPLRGLLPILLLGEQRHNECEQFA